MTPVNQNLAKHENLANNIENQLFPNNKISDTFNNLLHIYNNVDCNLRMSTLW